MRAIILGIIALFVAACTAPSAGVGGEDSSSADAAEPLEKGLPVPSGVHAEAGDGEVKVSWESPPGVPVERFHVYYRALMPGPPWDGNGAPGGAEPIQIDGATQTLITGLQNQTTIYVSVSLVSAGVEGPLSEPVKATPQRDGGALAWVAAGVFSMGATPGVNAPNEAPQHPVYLDGFWMDKYVATTAEYRACMDAGGCGPPPRESGYLQKVTQVEDYLTNPLYDSFPVVYLEHQNALDYCAWRGMRLPTEAEWEKAARGDREAAPLYPWGESAPNCEMANFNDDGIFCVGGTLPVGSYGANVSPYGVVEMGGNVWQWTSDWFDPTYYEKSPCKNPKGPDTGQEKVLRGGAWYYDSPALTVTYRNTWPPEFIFVGNDFGDYRGFGVRCVEGAPDVPCDPLAAICDLPESCTEEERPLPDVLPADAAETTDIDAYTPVADGSDADSVLLQPDGDGTPDTPAPPDTLDSADAKIDVAEPEPPPCFNPQDEVSDLTLCYDTPPPGCPSGWPAGCEVKACACAIGVSADPGTCGDEKMTVTVGWRDVFKNFYPFEDDEPVEICEGFQGGVHVAVVFKIDAPQVEGDSFYADVYARMTIDGIAVGSFVKETMKVSIADDGLFTTKLQQIRLEGCVGDAYEGHNAVIEVLVRDSEDDWGATTATVPLEDAVDGPFLDPAGQNPC